jgi:hypothetical protein
LNGEVKAFAYLSLFFQMLFLGRATAVMPRCLRISFAIISSIIPGIPLWLYRLAAESRGVFLS